MTRISTCAAAKRRKSDEVKWAQAALIMIAMGMIVGAILGT